MKQQKRLGEVFSQLPAEQQGLLLDFAEFLHQRYPPAPQATEPKAIPRPAKESVVAAVKRLSATYPMLEKAALLGETSNLVSQHLMGGREASAVIDDLDALFRDHYARQQRQG